MVKITTAIMQLTIQETPAATARTIMTRRLAAEAAAVVPLTRPKVPARAAAVSGIHRPRTAVPPIVLWSTQEIPAPAPGFLIAELTVGVIGTAS